MLTEEERELSHKVFAEGPSAFSVTDWSYAQIQDFLERADVQEEFSLLRKEFENQESLGSLARFMARRKLIRMKDTAIGVIQNALQGPRYLKAGHSGAIQHDAYGHPIVTEVEPTSTQLRAATEVLDRINVLSDKQLVPTGSVNVSVMFKHEEEEKIKIATDPAHTSAEQRSLSREKVRNVIEVLSKDIETHVSEAEAIMSGDAKKKKPKKPVKKPKKPASNLPVLRKKRLGKHGKEA